jgi:hypothetical protein
LRGASVARRWSVLPISDDFAHDYMICV